MSISVKNVTKLYGEQKALNQVSFDIQSGEIVGFLGPNGAGKSTMMKIITCYLPQTSGEVTVCGFDVNEQSIEVRKNVGYLPEHNPLYLEMYIKEYLRFSGGIYGLKNINQRVDDMIQLVGLDREKHKKIGSLSKGYRQRVGLAHALLHDPKVLILDEPTSGLDPNQIVEIRNLIKTIGKEKTVMLSTHILSEVEAICNRVIIIDRGVIKANDETQRVVQSSAKRRVLTVEFNDRMNRAALESVEGVHSAKHIRNNLWAIEFDADRDVRKGIFDKAVSERNAVLSLTVIEKTLEEVFKELTEN
ncbi:MAG TPA: gliding motility-associated ABC transporter ATP-binding subunit GldA [Luteibaculaceae bacterium]|nr:gliding motility-associated ABC transporter ATP-binding subunit GldA [Luteibaculaceae bacterium]